MADEDLLGSAALVAVIVTTAGVGAVAGAVYSPFEEIIPQSVPLQLVPDKVQVTAGFGVPVREAVNCSDAPVARDAVGGATLMATVVPVPVRAITAVPFVEELLLISN